MRARVEVKPALLRWAVERSGHPRPKLAARFAALEEWLQGEASPTLTQLENLAKATYTPIGFFFLPEPPVEGVPIPDFRTIAGPRAPRPSPDLLDTIYICQQRQEWYREFARSMGEQPLGFVGSTQVTEDVVTAAARIRDTLGFEMTARRAMSTWTDALRMFIGQADAAGILVMCSGVVLNNNRRRLDPHEFRGFAIADPLAPVVFINGADSKSAQMFTLAHELAHIWLGQSAVSDAEAGRLPKDEVERWCNQVAAELLVPLDLLRREYKPANDLAAELARLKPVFKVSNLVLLRRIRDAGGLTWEQLWTEHQREIERLKAIPKGSGGNFYLTQAARVSKRFARALVVSTWEGRSSFTEAFRLLGVKKMETFRGFEQSLGADGVMAYLLDANVFIQAKNLHYGLDFCPAFWEWLITENAAGTVLSIEKVGDEVQAVADELAEWAKDRGDGFFVPPDATLLDALAAVSGWAAGQKYEPAAISTFLQVADYYLVAQAHAGKHTVVTHEVPSASKRRIKIPDACLGLGIKFMQPHEMLRLERARFVLGPKG